jgi:hypothetical protein
MAVERTGFTHGLEIKHANQRTLGRHLPNYGAGKHLQSTILDAMSQGFLQARIGDGDLGFMLPWQKNGHGLEFDGVAFNSRLPGKERFEGIKKGLAIGFRAYGNDVLVHYKDSSDWKHMTEMHDIMTKAGMAVVEFDFVGEGSLALDRDLPRAERNDPEKKLAFFNKYLLPSLSLRSAMLNRLLDYGLKDITSWYTRIV